jgi:hypothetical protein
MKKDHSISRIPIIEWSFVSVDTQNSHLSPNLYNRYKDSFNYTNVIV